jgi:hypothetical protein
VLEVHERVAPLGPGDDRGPPGELGPRVGAVAEAEISEVRRRDHGRGPLLRVGDAERRVAAAEEVVDLVVEPRWVADLDGHPDGGRHPRETLAEAAGVLPEVRRKLEEERTALVAEPRDRVEKLGEGLGDVAQAGEMRDPLRHLEREDEPRGRHLRPAGDRLARRHPAEGTVELDRGKALRVVGQHPRGRETPGIEAAAPLGIAEA